jgi:cyclic pyranopterin phosphate synthase
MTEASLSLTHLDAQGQAHMVDVGHKAVTRREAVAAARVCFPADVYAQLQAQAGMTKKGAILEVARLAGIMAAKKTSDLIPLCHPMPLEKIQLTLDWNDARQSIDIRARVCVHHKTGVEMEALTAASVAALTIYDMCKALSHELHIEGVRLLSKTGGKRDLHQPESGEDTGHDD